MQLFSTFKSNQNVKEKFLTRRPSICGSTLGQCCDFCFCFILLSLS